MRRWAGICALLVVTAVVLTGCLGTKTLPVPDHAEPTLIVDYQRSGGIAGMNDRLVIFDKPDNQQGDPAEPVRSGRDLDGF